MRKLAILGLISAMFAPAAFAQGASRATLQVLNERIPEVSFEEAPFDQVMDWIADYTHTNTVVRWQQLENTGIERDKPISIRVKNLRVSQVLWMIMNEAGGPDVKLAYRASGNLLVLSTAEDLGQEMLLRVYDVSDLLLRVPRFTNSPRIDLTQQSTAGAGGGGQSVFGGSSGGGQDENNEDNQDQTGQEDPQATQLIDIITQTVEPDSWDINGGRGSIRAFGRQLIIRNNILVHQALGGAVEDAGE